MHANFINVLYEIYECIYNAYEPLCNWLIKLNFLEAFQAVVYNRESRVVIFLYSHIYLENTDADHHKRQWFCDIFTSSFAGSIVLSVFPSITSHLTSILNWVNGTTLFLICLFCFFQSQREGSNPKGLPSCLKFRVWKPTSDSYSNGFISWPA